MATTPRTGPEPALTLSTLDTTGVPVQIDGHRYRTRHPEALSLRAIKQLERLAPRVGGLLQQADLTEAEEIELSQGLQDVCRIVLDAPDKVITRLLDQQKVRVMEAFMQLRMSTRRPTPGAQPTPAPSRGKPSSRASRGSTAAMPGVGTPTSPSGS